jgi:hypothetical protein
MFGHDDTTKNGSVTAPEHEELLENNPALPKPEADDNDSSSPAYIMSSPKTGSGTAKKDVTLPVTPAASDDLIDIKQSALKMLTPLVGHLNQTPEEKFRTTMMMIQASDDQTLIKDAYEAAQAITDEKTKAQALLDIINEINYFTQQGA